MELDDPEMAQMLLEEMEEKEEQLRLAAEFGQTLLERTEELQEENEEMDEDTIIEEFRKGYKIGDTLIRASMVKVSTKP